MPDPREGSTAKDEDRQPEQLPPSPEVRRDRKQDLKGQDTEGGSTSPLADMYRDIPGDRTGG
jgi:hypothetical protein